MTSYILELQKLFHELQKNNESIVLECAQLLKKTIDSGGIIFIFGSGHSSLLAEEAFHRAGGLVPLYPIFCDFLSPRENPKLASRFERLEGVAPGLFERARVQSSDLLWIVSQSGINAAAIDMALECREKKVPTIGVTSLKHSKAVTSRHRSGKKLFELCDFVLDNQSPFGDALVDFNKDKVGAVSTITNCILYHWVVSEACKLWAQEGKNLPIYQSVNVPGGEQHNEFFEAQVRKRIPLL